MSTLIPRSSGLDRAEFTIRRINDFLPSPGEIRSPTGKSRKIRWSLRHNDLRLKTSPRQHPRVAATFDCDEVIGRTYEGRLSYDGSPVTAFYTQVLVPVLGRDIGLKYRDKNNDPVTYVATVEEVEALATEIRRVWPY